MGVKVREYKPGPWWLLIDHKGQRKAKKIGSKKAAMEAAAKIEAAIAANVLNLPSSDEPRQILFREYAAGWMEGHVRTNLKVSTQQAYRILLDKHILPTSKNKTLPEITRNEIKALCCKKAESSPPIPQPGPGDTSRSRTGGESSDFWPPRRDGCSSRRRRSTRQSSTPSS